MKFASTTKTMALILVVPMSVLVGDSAIADTVEIAAGGNLSGNTRRTSELVVVQVDDDIQVALPASRVRRVVDSTTYDQYRKYAKKAGDDAELNYQLAVWCAKEPLLRTQKRFHYQRAIELDPEHSRARAALGYVKEKGKWIRYSDLQRSRGLVSSAGRWTIPEAVAIETSQDEYDLATKQWVREINRLVKIVQGNNSDRMAEAYTTLSQIDDPLAALAIAEQLKDSRKNRSQPLALRKVWVNLLGKFRNGVSVAALVEASVEERDNQIRELALDKLLEYGSGTAISNYLAMMSPGKSNDLVRRGARALSYFPPDRELALTLTDALVTEHKKVKKAGPSTQAGFTNNGSGGFSTGGKDEVITVPVRNMEVLTLLKMIEPGVDYGFDESAWREHFANEMTAYSGDLRRDK